MNKNRISSRAAWVAQSEIRNMSIECDRVGGINLSQGVVDTEVPKIVREAAQKAIDDGINTYTRYDGLKELREAVAFKEKTFSGIEYDPGTEIIVSAGATGALYCACLALLEPGDEVIVFEPYYGYHISTLAAVEAVPKYVRLDPPDWHISEADIEKAITSKTRAMIVNTPANPSGKIFDRKELELIAGIAEKHDLIIFTDEIYEHFVYGDKIHLAPANIPGLRERTLTISGLSKTFSITGWRIGYCLCKKAWAEAIGHFNDLVYVCAPAPLQMGVAKGIMGLDNGYYKTLKEEYSAKREMICNALATGGLKPFVPDGAYYVLADINSLPGMSSKEKVMFLLEKTGVASVPGKAFYHDGSGEGLARFCFAKEDSMLDEACRRIKKWEQ